MKIDAIKGVVTIPISDLEFIQYYLLRSLANMRVLADKPLEPYENDDVGLTDFDFGCIGIIEAGQKLGIDFDVRNPHSHNEMDLTKHK